MKKHDKKVINSLPFTIFHKKLKSSILLFFCTLSLYLFSLYLKATVWDFQARFWSASLPRQTCMPLDELSSTTSRYHEFDVELDGCGAPCLLYWTRYLERDCVSCTIGNSSSMNPTRAWLTRYKNWTETSTAVWFANLATKKEFSFIQENDIFA